MKEIDVDSIKLDKIERNTSKFVSVGPNDTFKDLLGKLRSFDNFNGKYGFYSLVKLTIGAKDSKLFNKFKMYLCIHEPIFMNQVEKIEKVSIIEKIKRFFRAFK